MGVEIVGRMKDGVFNIDSLWMSGTRLMCEAAAVCTRTDCVRRVNLITQLG